MSCHLRGWLAPSVLYSNVWTWSPEPDLASADLGEWERRVTVELSRPQYAGGRVELLGDFPTDVYLTAWLDIARATPALDFHAVTAEADRMARLAAPDAPDNFRWSSPDEEHAASRGQSTERQAADSGDS